MNFDHHNVSVQATVQVPTCPSTLLNLRATSQLVTSRRRSQSAFVLVACWWWSVVDETHTDNETNRQTDRRTDKQAERLPGGPSVCVSPAVTDEWLNRCRRHWSKIPSSWQRQQQRQRYRQRYEQTYTERYRDSRRQTERKKDEEEDEIIIIVGEQSPSPISDVRRHSSPAHRSELYCLVIISHSLGIHSSVVDHLFRTLPPPCSWYRLTVLRLLNPHFLTYGRC